MLLTEEEKSWLEEKWLLPMTFKVAVDMPVDGCEAGEIGEQLEATGVVIEDEGEERIGEEEEEEESETERMGIFYRARKETQRRRRTTKKSNPHTRYGYQGELRMVGAEEKRMQSARSTRTSVGVVWGCDGKE